MYHLALVIILSYLAGSIPTAVIVSRLVLKDDIRNHGSKNAGATNVFRVMGWKPALFVVLVDIGKGILAVLCISGLAYSALSLDIIWIQIIAGFAAIFGHIWTVFAGFKGGKGVGTAFGVLVSLAPLPALIALAVWIILVVATRIVSVGSLSAGILFPVLLFLQKLVLNVNIPDPLLGLSIILGLLVVFTHRSNIGRLMRGEENKFGSNKK